MLFAERAGTALALACSVPWRLRSAGGFVGASDGWQDLHDHGELRPDVSSGRRTATSHCSARSSFPGRIGLPAGAGVRFDAAEAGHRARAALHDGFDTPHREYIRQWDAWQDSLLRLDALRPGDTRDRYRISTAVMRTHEATSFPGGTIASLSIRWGFNKGDEDLGGYHLVWPRDLVETAGGLLAAGAVPEVRRILS